jgi:hypothetical protein
VRPVCAAPVMGLVSEKLIIAPEATTFWDLY